MSLPEDHRLRQPLHCREAPIVEALEDTYGRRNQKAGRTIRGKLRIVVGKSARRSSDWFRWEKSVPFLASLFQCGFAEGRGQSGAPAETAGPRRQLADVRCGNKRRRPAEWPPTLG